jgi:hypothetical protein
MDIENETVRRLAMPPPSAPLEPYQKSRDHALNPLSISSTLRPQPAQEARGECTVGGSSSQPTPTGGASTHVTDVAKDYAAAATAISKTTPKTEENRRTLASNDPVIREQVEEQMARLKPRGRVQRLLSMAPTPEEQRAHRTQKRREQRARRKLLQSLQGHYDALVRRLQDVGQYSDKGLELWELLMIELSLQPSNVGSSGQMRTRYQEQLYAARLKEYLPRQRGVKRALQCVEHRPCNARTQPCEHNLARRAGDRVRVQRVWPHPHRRDMHVNLKEACLNPKR